MTDVIKMEYEQAEEMIQVLNQAAQQLEDTVSEMQSIATQLENGALLGRAGDAFSDALRSKLCTAIQRLNDTTLEGARYVQKEKEDMQEAERQSGSLFQG